MTCEVNFDTLAGPTHHYGGLSYGNIPSMENRLSSSNPREAALQGLDKMKLLADLGIIQGVLPPHERPHLPTMRALGFSGTDEGIIKATAAQAPELLIELSSSAFMWTANAATVCPSADSIDRFLHFTPANLSNKFHRSIEHSFTEKILKFIFKNPTFFKHHAPLPGAHFSDEGAANHMRFCQSIGSPGIQLFVFGRHSFQSNPLAPKKFPGRQAYEASLAVSRLHQLFPKRALFVQQNPIAIDAGAFHNDVVAISHCNFFLFHEQAFIGKEALVDEIKAKVAEVCESDLFVMEVKENVISLQEAVSSYFFNSQIVTLPKGGMCIIAPAECEANERIKKFIDDILQTNENPIKEAHYVHLRQSMRNGGGPACLRLRIAMNANELAAIHQPVLLDNRLYQKLSTWISKHYRDRLEPKDLSDPKLLIESQNALNELTKILQLGSIYDFQTSHA